MREDRVRHGGVSELAQHGDLDHGHDLAAFTAEDRVSAFMNTGAYHASKWALEGFSQSLSQEVAGFGIKVTLIEPTGYSTDWSGSSAKHAAPLPVYDHIRDAAAKARAQRFTAPGNPVATGDAILTLVDSHNPPLRLFLGESPLRIVVEDYGSRLAAWAPWQQVAAAAQGTQD
jgi:NAD(P)-dependent dehydrogenase (short-subunit alcohol dehydrogenase family)